MIASDKMVVETSSYGAGYHRLSVTFIIIVKCGRVDRTVKTKYIGRGNGLHTRLTIVVLPLLL